MRIQSKNKIKRNLLLTAIILILTVVGSIIIKYYVEGESNMPFKLTKLMVISSARGVEEDSNTFSWNMNLEQVNDIYLDIAKNKNYAETEIIKEIILSDIMVNESPVKGNVVFCTVNTGSNDLEQEILDNKIIFKGAEKTDLSNLEISNQGGLILFRCINKELGNYVSENKEDITHDGTILKKCEVNNEDIKFTISFNLEIVLESGVVFKAKLEQDLPIGNIVEQGVTNYQKTDFSDIVFKRE